MTDNDTVEVRVARGAALLDAQVPGWWDRVEVLALDMRRPCKCVLGQVFYSADVDDDGYSIGRDELGLKQEHGGGDDPTQTHGFDAVHADGLGFTPDYNALQREWTRVIESRRGAA